MFFIADIPPVTQAQETEYNYYISKSHFLNENEINNLHSIVFLIQANRFIELSESTDFEKAELNYESMALLNFQAYLERLGE